MTSSLPKWGRWARFLWQAVLGVGFTAGVIVLVLWLAGKFEPKVNRTESAETVAAPGGSTVSVQLEERARTETAVGTIRAVHETAIGSKLLARVVEVNLKAGQKVKAGDVLVRLDDSELVAKLQQAQAAVTAAEAHHVQAGADEKRYGNLVKTGAISRQQYEKAATELRSAEAELRRATEGVKEVQALLQWATIRSPLDGVVIDKKVDAGDTVTPGQTLATLYDPQRMQLVASVRESLVQRLEVGQEIGVMLGGMSKQCAGTVSEIVPEAQATSRSFQVKVVGPCPPGIYTGMFGRLVIPLGKEQVLVIPAAAVRRIGQLELVEVREGTRAERRAIRVGRSWDGKVEVLSGLREGEQVVLPAGVQGEGVRHD